MRRQLPADSLARDERFVRRTLEDRLNDPRLGGRAAPSGPAQGKGVAGVRGRFDRDRPGAPDQARALMHGIFVGEIQALEGAGRTCFDYDTGSGDDEIPFELKLDMARQCWDEARHCEISVRLAEWMGTEIGEFAESTMLFEASCNADPVLRLAGVNRGLEGLAIDVFNTMRDFGASTGDPVLEFCEDWMLADEVTHVKMGSDWLRRLTSDDPDRRQRALDFQRIVDRLFSYGGFRGDDEDSPIRLARQFRHMAGFTTEEIDRVADEGRRARSELAERAAAST
jgi:uncharacterized ferritin-like protein (DUF455 family)